jgi:predicted metal-binding protein
VQSSTFEKPREYARITLDGTAIEVERCRFEKCELVESERDYGDL